MKAQKVEGTTQIVRHISAPDEWPTSAGEWIELWVAALEGQLAGAPPLPLGYCFP